MQTASTHTNTVSLGPEITESRAQRPEVRALAHREHMEGIKRLWIP